MDAMDDTWVCLIVCNKARYHGELILSDATRSWRSARTMPDAIHLILSNKQTP